MSCESLPPDRQLIAEVVILGDFSGLFDGNSTTFRAFDVHRVGLARLLVFPAKTACLRGMNEPDLIRQ